MIASLDATTALIVIDLQKGLMSFPTSVPLSAIVQKASQLTAAFRAKSLPVVLVNVTGGAPGRTDSPRPAGQFPPDFAELMPELAQAPTDHLVTKKTWGAFSHTDLDSYLRGKGVTQVVILGVATSIGVESTARFAHELGYHVVLVTDAMTDMRPEAHENSLTRIFPRLGECATTEQVLGLVGKLTG
jgi:nicotinamidase-related amidase